MPRAAQPHHADEIVRIIAARDGMTLLQIAEDSGVRVKDVMAVLLYERGKRIQARKHLRRCHFDEVIWEVVMGEAAVAFEDVVAGASRTVSGAGWPVNTWRVDKRRGCD